MMSVEIALGLALAAVVVWVGPFMAITLSYLIVSGLAWATRDLSDGTRKLHQRIQDPAWLSGVARNCFRNLYSWSSVLLVVVLGLGFALALHLLANYLSY